MTTFRERKKVIFSLTLVIKSDVDITTEDLESIDQAILVQPSSTHAVFAAVIFHGKSTLRRIAADRVEEEAQETSDDGIKEEVEDQGNREP